MNKELDLIDRDELYRQIRLYLRRHTLGETRISDTLTIGEIATIIDEIPAVNTKIEETADWLMRSVIVDDKELWIYECSKCGCIKVKPKEHEYDNYCSNCGRHMDGGEN